MSRAGGVLAVLNRAHAAFSGEQAADIYAAAVAITGLRKEAEAFKPLARWVANCAGHGINAGQREAGERLLVWLDSISAGEKP